MYRLLPQNIIDAVIEHIVLALIPVPGVASIVSQSIKRYKLQILFLCFVLIILLGSYTNQVLGSGQYYPIENYLPSELKDYREPGFDDTTIPLGNPLGRDANSFAVTAYYRDINYYQAFHRWHDGIDIIPSQIYYSTNKAYQLVKDIVLFSPVSGKLCSDGSISIGFTLTVETYDHEYKILLHHQKLNYLPVGTCASVIAGQPIGIMGQTGNATGTHTHYMIYIKNKENKWIETDPYTFMTQ